MLIEQEIHLALLNETWFDSEKGIYRKRIKDYGFKVFHDYRKDKRGGGVAFLFKNNLAIKEYKASTSLYVSFEFACMILSLKASCKTVLVSIYRKQEIP